MPTVTSTLVNGTHGAATISYYNYIQEWGRLHVLLQPKPQIFLGFPWSSGTHIKRGGAVEGNHPVSVYILVALAGVTRLPCTLVGPPGSAQSRFGPGDLVYSCPRIP